MNTDIKSMTIAARLNRLGFSYGADDRTVNTHKHAIYSGESFIGRMDSTEAVAMCARFGG